MSDPFVEPETDGEDIGTRRRIGGTTGAGESVTHDAGNSGSGRTDADADADALEHDHPAHNEPAEPAETTEAAGRRRPETTSDPARLLRRSARRTERVPTAGGSTLHLLVLSSTLEDTTVVDLATRTVMRVRVPWPEGFAIFDLACT